MTPSSFSHPLIVIAASMVRAGGAGHEHDGGEHDGGEHDGGEHDGGEHSGR